jgi:hypothetical protein
MIYYLTALRCIKALTALHHGTLCGQRWRLPLTSIILHAHLCQLAGGHDGGAGCT